MSKKLGVISISILLVSIVGIAIGINAFKANNENKNPESIIENNENENTVKYDEIDGVCRIIGDNSNLLYKNDYETDTAYSEKVIFLDEQSKNQSKKLDVNNVLFIGAFEGEFIKVKYNSRLNDNETFWAYATEGEFYNCKTNKMFKKALDKNGNEVDMPKFDIKNYDTSALTSLSKAYVLFDVTTEKGEDFIIGMYNDFFTDNNPNSLLITVVLKKQNANIDINDEKQIENFWNKYAIYELEEVTESSKGNYEAIDIDGTIYYHRLTENTWNGEYHQDKYYTSTENSKSAVVSYKEYLNYLNEINANSKEKIKNYYTDEKSNYIILSYANGKSWCDIELIDCIEANNQITIYGDEDVNGVMADGSGYLVVIPTNMPVGTKIQYRECYSTSEISNLQNYKTSQPGPIIADKPIIYLYPKEETKVSIKLLNDKNLTYSYPKYERGWNVLAQPNGNLKDLTTNRNLYSLYYESISSIDFKVNDEGFLVKGEDTIKFLEEKLAILGLTEREAEEFIIYWLPKLECNKYNYIRFATLDEINENMPLLINPTPDTTIRILMIFKGLDNPIDVKEQKLVTPDRTGFVAVEWGRNRNKIIHLPINLFHKE